MMNEDAIDVNDTSVPESTSGAGTTSGGTADGEVDVYTPNDVSEVNLLHIFYCFMHHSYLNNIIVLSSSLQTPQQPGAKQTKEAEEDKNVSVTNGQPFVFIGRL